LKFYVTYTEKLYDENKIDFASIDNAYQTFQTLDIWQKIEQEIPWAWKALKKLSYLVFISGVIPVIAILILGLGIGWAFGGFRR